MRRPSAPTPIGPTSPGEPAEGTTIGDMTFFRFDEGRQRIQLKAQGSRRDKDGVAHLQGVEVTLPYVHEGREATVTITSDEGRYDAVREDARFEGHVHVITDDGFELWTESLDYIGRQDRVVSRVDVRFERGTASGRARGAEYTAAEDLLELKSNVSLRFEDPDGGPVTEIESGRARGSRRSRVINFGEGVEVRQGTRVLRSRRLQLILDEQLESIQRAAAIRDVELHTTGGGDLGGVELPPGGERHLRSRRLNMDFRPGGDLQRAVAVNHAVLEVLPGPGDPPEKRRIAGSLIRFDFDEEGQLYRVQGRSGGGQAADRHRPVVISTEPVPPGPGVPRRVECSSFAWNLAPGQGTLRTAVFKGAVRFTEPGRRAWAESATYHERKHRLRLRGGAPRIVDEEDGSELQAQEIEVATDTRGVVAVGGVRHSIRRSRGGPEGGMLAGSEPTVLVCRRFEYEPTQRKAWYRENALLRSGDDEVRAPLIVLEDPAPSARRLHASGGVLSLLRPRSSSEAKGEAALVQARSQDMVYEEAAGRVVYTGDVEIRQGDITTRSPEAVVTLTEAGDDLETIVAGEPVEVQQGQRRARGQTGTYTPGTETLVLKGEEVVLEDVDRSVRGRILTFQVGEDRIRVDGQEAVRTEAIFKTRELPTP
jgi:lipopolysaccharide transport protein LptA/LPS export ABC transporter protein LptC